MLHSGRPAGLPLLVNVNWAHHANGGYGALTRFVPSSVLEYPSPPRGTSRVDGVRRVLDIARFNGEVHRSAKNAALVHLLYADTTVLPEMLRARYERVFCTVHLPLAPDRSTRAADRLRDQVLDRANGIVVLSSEQVQRARERFPRARIAYIPHGLDVGAFPTSPPKADRPSFAIVGANLRDWVTLNTVLKAVIAEKPDWRFHLVGVPAEWARNWAIHESVVWHGRLTSDEYLSLLGQCWGILLAVRDATANNAILEAHAMGTTVVATDLSSIRDYACETTRLFRSPEEALVFLSELEGLNDATRMGESELSRLAAQRFDWPRIADEVTAFYGASESSHSRSATSSSRRGMR